MKRRLGVLVLIIMLITSSTVLGHSGRTDANGGHKDNKNKSGLGAYHYHHGMGPHLHPNGVCPYNNVEVNEAPKTTEPATETSTTKKEINTEEKKEESKAIGVLIDGEAVKFDVDPTVIDGRTLVPVRAIFEALGATIEWNGETKTVTGKKGDITVSLTIDNKKALINDKEMELEVPAKIIDGRTLVPVRFITESMNATVTWDENNRNVVIVTKS